ncbi:hypothetical protein Ptr902_09602 [Pyrenophora tritici-repentis]|nr:hypothetical protein Alg130_10954 [Pyrenophora tritici-repentis]KAI1663296.1 hypothetical protein L13192_12648 [Pyrenophora tritici-repentis]KAI1663859.1 hypothetical protein L13192_12256 [Pyrenophora tritici-repentis]KAI1668007.1 hypothetical protein L13192_08716 [Pyrenophora tritici-repentis]KAI2474831.1 hypothetical protein Ptr902_13764 [Pyrenophora tritici-repentis]
MDTPNAVYKDAADRDERFSTDADVGNALPRPASYPTIVSACATQQGASQQSQILQLVLAMASLRLDNRETQDMVEKEYKVLDTAARSQHSPALDEEYVFVDKLLCASRVDGS